MAGKGRLDPGAGRYGLSVKALIRSRADRYLLLRRSPDSRIDPGLWDLPGGKVDCGEDFAAALLREVREEIGLDITLERLEGAAQAERPGLRIVHLIMAARLAVGDEDAARVRLSSEHVAHLWVPRAGLVDLELCPGMRPIVWRFARGSEE